MSLIKRIGIFILILIIAMAVVAFCYVIEIPSRVKYFFEDIRREIKDLWRIAGGQE